MTDAPEELIVSRAAAPPLRIAVVVGPRPRRWHLACLRLLAASGEAELVALWLPAAPVPARPWPGLYAAMVGGGCPALAPADLPSDLPGWSNPGQGAPPDAVLVLEGEAPAGAERPVQWRFRFGTAESGELPGQREMARGRRSITLALLAGEAAQPLHAAVLKTRRSHRLTLAALLEAAPAVLLGACRRRRRDAPGARPELPDLPAATPLRAGLGQAGRVLVGAADRMLRHDVWSIGVVSMSAAALVAGAPLPAPRWLKPPRPGRFHADPFPLLVDGHPWLLFEMWEEAQGRGWIAGAPLDSMATEPDTAGVALDVGCHMSYPAVFTWRGENWCAPEISALGGLRLFRMGATPRDWTLAAVALEGLPLLDPTLFEYAGRWWLLATLAMREPDTDLHAWHAPTPLGPWTAHALNPVVSNVHGARPAGAVFRHAGALYRPAQDCAAGYGRAVVVNRITRLDPDGYAEVAVRRVAPDPAWPFPEGLHTLNLAGDQIVIDAKRRDFGTPAALCRGGRGGRAW